MLEGRYYFTGPEWLIELMKKVYGDSIDYYVQQKIPQGTNRKG